MTQAAPWTSTRRSTETSTPGKMSDSSPPVPSQGSQGRRSDPATTEPPAFTARNTVENTVAMAGRVPAGLVALVRALPMQLVREDEPVQTYGPARSRAGTVTGQLNPGGALGALWPGPVRPRDGSPARPGIRSQAPLSPPGGGDFPILRWNGFHQCREQRLKPQERRPWLRRHRHCWCTGPPGDHRGAASPQPRPGSQRPRCSGPRACPDPYSHVTNDLIGAGRPPDTPPR